MDRKTHTNTTWQIDSETGDELLIDCDTWRIVAIKKADGTVIDVDRRGLDE